MSILVGERLSRQDLTRVRLAEVLATVLGVEQVPPGSHFFDDLGADSMTMARFCARVRKVEGLPAVSMRDIYEHSCIDGLVEALVVPAEPDAAAALADERVAVQAGIRDRLTEVLAGVLGVEHVSSSSHFFDDLGADSMTMARFCARVRKVDDVPAVSMRDVYEHSCIDSLVEALAAPAAGSLDGDAVTSRIPDSPAELVTAAETGEPPPLRSGGSVAYVMTGIAQLVLGIAYASLNLVIIVKAYEWVALGDGWIARFERSLVAGAIVFFIPIILPIVLKWLLVGRWKPREIRIWSLGYLRFWVVRALMQMNPMVLFFRGSPLFSVYLRLLGARIGPGTIIFARGLPVCTDLLTIGAGAVIRKDALLPCYRAEDGIIETGPVTIGAYATVGVAGVLDIYSSIGERGQLGHASSLHRGQHIPHGESWSGTPAEPGTANYRLVGDERPRRVRRFCYSVSQLTMVCLFIPVFFVIADTLLTTPQLAPLLSPELAHAHTWTFYAVMAAGTAVLTIVGIPVTLLVVCTVPRILNRFVPADRDILLYGPRYVAQQFIGRMTNIPAMGVLFGDSSYVTTYLRALGYRLGTVVQTGSNFGQMFKHDNPFLCSVGTGTMIADGITFSNATYSSTSFRLSQASIGARSFLGNFIVYPSDSRAGDDVLLGTKVMVPIEGPRQEHTGLLGAPSVRIPRTVRRDADLGIGRGETRRRLRRKNVHNIVTMAMYLFVRWLWAFIALTALVVAIDFYPVYGLVVTPVLTAGLLIGGIAYWVAIDRWSARLQLHAPNGRTIYDREFWNHERYWKVPSPFYRMLAIGTPFMGLLWRLAGAKVGRRLFDDGILMAEKTFVTIGDDCTFNSTMNLQGHSQEDGAFKSDYIVVGSRCTLGVASFVHYGTTLGDHSTLATNSFLMKGEEIPAGEHWGGNPASPMPTDLERLSTSHLPRG